MLSPTIDPPSTAMSIADSPREALEIAALHARDYSQLAARIFRADRCDVAEFADQIMRDQVACNGGCDSVLLRDESLPKVLRNLRCLEITTIKPPDGPNGFEVDLPDDVLLDVTALGDDHLDAFEPVSWKRDVWCRGQRPTLVITCRPTKLETVEGRVMLTMEVKGEVDG